MQDMPVADPSRPGEAENRGVSFVLLATPLPEPKLQKAVLRTRRSFGRSCVRVAVPGVTDAIRIFGQDLFGLARNPRRAAGAVESIGRLFHDRNQPPLSSRRRLPQGRRMAEAQGGGGRGASLAANARSLLLLLLLSTALLVPFLGKPLHLDDPMYVWTAERIAQHPGDFYGLDVNWCYTREPMARANDNPPLVSYALAAAGA